MAPNYGTEDKICKIVNIAAHLKFIIERCQEEHSKFTSLAKNVRRKCPNAIKGTRHQLSSFSGDGLAVNAVQTRTAKSTTKSFKEEQLNRLINKAASENLRLRESNVKLQRECKNQDKKIRELNHKISVEERLAQQRKSERATIRELKNVIESKTLEIQRLKHDVKAMTDKLVKEQKMTRRFENLYKIGEQHSTMKLDDDVKVDELVARLNYLLKELDPTPKDQLPSNRGDDSISVEPEIGFESQRKQLQEKLMEMRMDLLSKRSMSSHSCYTTKTKVSASNHSSRGLKQKKNTFSTSSSSKRKCNQATLWRQSLRIATKEASDSITPSSNKLRIRKSLSDTELVIPSNIRMQNRVPSTAEK